MVVEGNGSAGGGAQVNALPVNVADVDIAIIGKGGASAIFGRTAQTVALGNMVNEQVIKIVAIHKLPVGVAVKTLLPGIININGSEIVELETAGKITGVFILPVKQTSVAGSPYHNSAVVVKRQLAVIGIIIGSIRSGAVHFYQSVVYKIQYGGGIGGFI